MYDRRQNFFIVQASAAPTVSYRTENDQEYGVDTSRNFNYDFASTAEQPKAFTNGQEIEENLGRGDQNGGSQSVADFGRIQSNDLASSSKNGSETFRQANMDDLFLVELKACESLEDIMEMAIEESESMDGAWTSACLLRFLLLLLLPFYKFLSKYKLLIPALECHFEYYT